MRARTLLLVLFAIILAGGTALLARSWLAAERSREVAEVAARPAEPPKAAKSVLVSRSQIGRGQILRAEDLVWQVWPEGNLDKNYIISDGPKKPDNYAGWVAVNPIAQGEPVTESRIIAPGNRGFLAAVLRPGMRAISVPVTVTSGISGFIFPGDQVDLLVTHNVPTIAAPGANAPSFEHKATETVLQNIRVIAIDQRLESKAGEAVPAHTATFEVTPKQAEAISLANELGKVSLTLRSLRGTQEPETAGSKEVSPAGAPAPSAPVRSAPVASATAPDSPSVASATYTMDDEISPLLPKRAAVKGNTATGVVTILRGTAKASEPVSPQPEQQQGS